MPKASLSEIVTDTAAPRRASLSDIVQSPAEVHAQLEQANATPLQEASGGGGGILSAAGLQSLGHTASETAKGIIEGPWESLKAGMKAKADREAQWGQDALKGGGRLITGPEIKAGVSNLVSGAVETVKGLPAALSDPRTGGRAIGTLALPMAAEYGGPIVGRALTAAAESPLPGRLMRATGAGTWNAAKNTPLVGRPIAAFARGAGQSWKASAPPAATVAEPAALPFVKPPTPAMSGLEVTKALKLGITPEEIQTLTREQILAKLNATDQAAMTTKAITARLSPTPQEPPLSTPPNPTKPKLSAAETAQYLRNEYGSERAGRMLYGTKGADRPDVLTPATRQANIKRLAPQTQSSLPESTMRELRDKVRLMSPKDAAAYAELAPNKLMRQYLLDLMKSH